MLRFVLLAVLATSAFAGIVRRPLQAFEGRIIGGGNADQGEYPSQLTLQYLVWHICGASIISETFVLTASHCVDGLSAAVLSVRSGSVNLSEGTRHQVTRVIMHENFDALDSFNNDIAILEVEPPFVYGPYVQPIALPNQGDEPAVGTAATVIGWGQIEDGGALSAELKELVVEIRDQKLCQTVYNGIGYDVYPGQICADFPDGNIGACNGDSGGPLFVDGVVVGLVSWSDGCAIPGYPTVYNRVAYYRNWITQQTGVN
ncbi:trypsin-1-like [Neocloeon triangulifer]|uniref:trypsin-1-like n=1 Tax=Neocloeon triangulifer TaxID=2078957 RepID=UPI00286F9C26|nr:trypsin-1-like [Neocloeon triangulifer]